MRPELAALSSCQMLTFLSIAALKGYVVDRYEDEASAELGKNDRGRMMIARAVLRPRVIFGGDKRPDAATLGQLHEKAHGSCFVANSLLTEMSIEPR